MYIVEQDRRCGQCSALNQHEFVSRGNEYLIKCKRCGHEKVISVTTTSSTKNAIIYDSVKPTSSVVF